MEDFKLTEEYIELIRLLKYLRWCESGGEAKSVVEAGRVKRNGITEYRKRAKLRRGDVVEFGGSRVTII